MRSGSGGPSGLVLPRPQPQPARQPTGRGGARNADSGERGLQPRRAGIALYLGGNLCDGCLRGFKRRDVERSRNPGPGQWSIDFGVKRNRLPRQIRSRRHRRRRCCDIKVGRMMFEIDRAVRRPAQRTGRQPQLYRNRRERSIKGTINRQRAEIRQTGNTGNQSMGRLLPVESEMKIRRTEACIQMIIAGSGEPLSG